MARTRTETINDLYTSTYEKVKATVRDQVFNAQYSAFWSMLRQKGGLVPQRGGRQIVRNLQVSKNDQLYALAKGSTVPLQDFEHLDRCYWDWKYYDKPIVRYWQDDQKIKGEYELLNMIKSKIKNSTTAYGEDVETLLFGDNSSESLELQGLQHLVADDPTASRTVGGIDQSSSSFTWWRNNAVNFNDYIASGTGPTGSVDDTDWLAEGVGLMREMIQDCQDKTDIIATSQHMFNLMQDDLMSFFQWDGRMAADLGIPTRTPTFNGIPVVWSRRCGNRMYFLDLDALYLVYDPDDFLTLGKWMDIPQQVNDVVAHMTLVGSFCVEERRSQGVIYNLPS